MSETTTTKLSASHVIVGKELQMDVYHKSGVLLVKRGHYVLTEEQKQRLLANGEISKDAKMAAAERELRERREKQQEQQRKERESRGRNPLVEMDSLAHKMRGLLNHYFHVSEFEAQVTQVAQRLATLAEQQPDGLIASCLLVPFQDYGSTHSLHTAAILAVLGRRLKLPADEMQVLLCAALTMNISATGLHSELTKQQAKLSNEQQQQMYGHPLLSSALLRDLGVENERWHLLVQQHHEEWNGAGYPYGLKKEEIDPGSHLIRLTDVLTSLLISQAHRAGRLPSIALARLYKGEFSEFDSRFVALLIKELGIYPPGSFVRLANQEIAIVTHRAADGNNTQPRVASVRAANGEVYGEPMPRNTGLADYAISQPVSPQEAGVRPAFLLKLWNS